VHFGGGELRLRLASKAVGEGRAVAGDANSSIVAVYQKLHNQIARERGLGSREEEESLVGWLASQGGS
jgi:hypothetical protein